MPFKCSSCTNSIKDISPPYSCGKCGDVILYHPPLEELKPLALHDASFSGVWRFWKMLPPIADNFRISLGEGGTFLHRAERLATQLGLRHLYLKNETTNPSGSFVDRGIAIEISKALSMGFAKLACISHGNLGVSVAAYAAKTGLNCTIYTPPNIERGKLYQLIAYDAEIIFQKKISPKEIRDSTDNLYLISTTSPFFLAGLKTIAYEVLEQLQKVPNIVIVPVGSGGNIAMFWEGMRELHKLGVTNGSLPKLVAVQSDGCMPIVEAHKRGLDNAKWRKRVRTLFPDIAVPSPLLGRLALRAIRESRGLSISVSDGEIIDATRILAKSEGIFAEPAAASTIAALRKMVENNMLDRDDVIVCIITGSGLKEPFIIRPIGRAARTVAVRTRPASRVGRMKTLILKLLAEKPMHGYALWKNLRKRFGVTVSTVSIYQHLAELQDSGLITAAPLVAGYGQSKRKRTFYELTILGRRMLDQMTTN
ncbi:MAG: threonine synthase [Aigarchaeota archaeon]|nr:threonine synthase [Candidatus Pelearchaeum maunauluense]